MKKRSWNPTMLLIGVYFLTFLFISIAYSFFNEKLTLRGISSIVKGDDYEYSSVLNNSWVNSGFHFYQFTPTITYLGNEEHTNWQANIKIPTGTEIIGCYNASECSVVGDILRVKNASYNGIVSKNTSFSFSFQMKTTITDYQFEIESVIFGKNDNGNPNIPEEPDPDPNENPGNKIDGFIVKIERGNFWGNTTQFSVSVENNSDISLSSWSLVLNVPNGSTIASLWGASYILKDNTIVLSGPAWSLGLPAKGKVTGIGIQLTTTLPAPSTITKQSLKGVTTAQQDVEMNI